MKKEKQVRSYKRRTKSGKTVTVKAHTAKYEAADEKAKEVSKKPGAGKELEERKKKPIQLELPFDKEEEKKVLDEVKDEEKKSEKKEANKEPKKETKKEKKVRPVGSGTNGPEPKKKSGAKVTKDPSPDDPNWELKMRKKYNKSKGDLTELKNAISTGKGTEIRKALKNYKSDAQKREAANPNKVHSDIANGYAHDLLAKAGYNQYGYKNSKWKSTTHTLDTKTGKLSAPIKSSVKTTSAKASSPAFTAAEFKEWYRGTGSAADKKVAKALRAQLGRSGYKKLEDEAIDNYSSRGHLSMFKRVSGGSEVSAKTGKSGAKEKAAEAKVPKSEFTQPPHSIKYKYKGETYYIKRKNVGGLTYKPTDVLNSKGEKLSKDEAATIKAAQQKSAERADKRGDRRSNGDKERMRLHGWADMGESTNKTEPKASTASGKSSTKSGNVKKETKGDRAVARMHKLVNEALSSTTSDPKALKKQLGALIDYNGGPINYGDKIGKRIDEIREQLGKRSSSKLKRKTSTK